ACRSGGSDLPATVAPLVEELFDTDAEDATARHDEITTAAVRLAGLLGERARAGGLGFDAFPDLGQRLARFALAGALQAPFLSTARHHAHARRDLAAIESAVFRPPETPSVPPASLLPDPLR